MFISDANISQIPNIRSIKNYELRGKKWIVRIFYRSYGFCSQSLQVWSTQGWQVCPTVRYRILHVWSPFPYHIYLQTIQQQRQKCKPFNCKSFDNPATKTKPNTAPENCCLFGIQLYRHLSVSVLVSHRSPLRTAWPPHTWRLSEPQGLTCYQSEISPATMNDCMRLSCLHSGPASFISINYCQSDWWQLIIYTST